jgi:hypothetical protein
MVVWIFDTLKERKKKRTCDNLFHFINLRSKFWEEKNIERAAGVVIPFGSKLQAIDSSCAR